VQPANPPGCPCLDGLSGDGLIEILTFCGLQWLFAKSQEFAGLIHRENPGQALYLGVCRSLGYSRNKAPMARLAGLLPLSFWKSVDSQGPERKLALAIGTAGLLPSQNAYPPASRTGGLAGVLEREWSGSSRRITPMPRSGWCFNYIRPANSPPRRVAALCALVENLGTGWLQFFRDLIEAAGIRRAASLIEKCLVIEEDGYWSNHYDFGSRMNRPASVLGKGRAREITVNSILPFFLAYGWATGDRGLAGKIVDIYTAYPALPKNEVTSFMSRHLKAEGKAGVNGCGQQGLLHIFHTYCRTRECEKCPVLMRRKPGWGRHPSGHRQSARS
jgi:hypothetical protein